MVLMLLPHLMAGCFNHDCDEEVKEEHVKEEEVKEDPEVVRIKQQKRMSYGHWLKTWIQSERNPQFPIYGISSEAGIRMSMDSMLNDYGTSRFDELHWDVLKNDGIVIASGLRAMTVGHVEEIVDAVDGVFFDPDQKSEEVLGRIVALPIRMANNATCGVFVSTAGVLVMTVDLLSLPFRDLESEEDV